MIYLVLKLVDRLIQLLQIGDARLKRVFHEVIEPLYGDLKGIHENYGDMFRTIEKEVPFPFESGSPTYAARIRKAAKHLVELRAEFEPVRNEVAALSSHFGEFNLPSALVPFCTAVIDYLPRGEFKQGGSGQDKFRSSSTLLVDALYAELETQTATDIRDLIQVTLRKDNETWTKVLEEYQRLRILVSLHD